MGGGASTAKLGAQTKEELFAGCNNIDPRICAVSDEEAIECIATAFCGTADSPKEELINWIIGSDFADFNSPERMEVCRYNGKFATISCTKKGTVVGLRDPDSKEVLGVMLTRRTPETMTEMMGTMSKAGKYPLMNKKVYGPGPMKRDGATEKAMKKLSHKGPQHILYSLAVKPAHQKKGVAKALVAALLAAADRDQLPTHVDCAGENLEKMYTHLGFVKQADAELVDPTGGESCSMCTLMRSPVSAVP